MGHHVNKNNGKCCHLNLILCIKIYSKRRLCEKFEVNRSLGAYQTKGSEDIWKILGFQIGSGGIPPAGGDSSEVLDPISW